MEDRGKRLVELTRVSRVWFYSIAIFNSLVIILLLGYTFSVPQNLVFTDSDITVEHIPYYSLSKGTWQTERWNFYYWWFATDQLNWAIPIVLWFYISGYFIAGPHPPGRYILGVSFLVILNAAKAIERSIRWWFCVSFQFCRNHDVEGNPSDPNWIFLTEFVFTIVFLLVSIACVIILKVMYASIIAADKGVKTQMLNLGGGARRDASGALPRRTMATPSTNTNGVPPSRHHQPPRTHY